MDTAALTERRLEAYAGGAHDDATPDAPSGVGLVPLLVGITGHRDLGDADRELLVAAVREVFVELQGANPGRPLTLLTALAEGADTLVTRIALEFGARLVVVLPMAHDDYERDFAGPARDDFLDLLYDRHVVRRVVIPTVGRKAEHLDAETRRALQYALAGAYIADHADALIALWDGLPSDRVGGTAHVVHYRRAGTFDVDAAIAACFADVAAPFGLYDDLLAPPRVGSVHHVVTPRGDAPRPEAAFTRAILPPYSVAPSGLGNQTKGGAHAESVAGVDARIRKLSDEAREFERTHAKIVDAIAEDLYPTPDAPPGETRSTLPRGLASLRRSFALADALAIRYQRRLNNALLWIFASIFVGGVAFALFTHEFAARGEASPVPIGTYAVLFAIADAIFIVVKLGRWQDKYQDYRAIAEGLRVQFYWRLAGLEHAASDYYVRHQRDELAWIPRVARACGAVAPPIPHGRLDEVHAFWAAPQAAYYARACAHAQQNLRWRHAGTGALGASILIGFGLLWRVSAGLTLLRVVLLPVALLLVAHAGVELLDLLGGDHAASVDGRDSRWWDIAARTAGLIAGLGAAAFMVNIPVWWFPHLPRWTPHESVQWLFLSLGITALAGGLLRAHSQVRAFAEHARRYGRLAAIFHRGAEALRTSRDAENTDRRRALIIELGKESLSDHGDWVILHRERPIELPETGG